MPVEDFLANLPITVEDLIANPWFWAISLAIDFFWISKLVDWLLGSGKNKRDGGIDGVAHDRVPTR